MMMNPMMSQMMGQMAGMRPGMVPQMQLRPMMQERGLTSMHSFEPKVIDRNNKPRIHATKTLLRFLIWNIYSMKNFFTIYKPPNGSLGQIRSLKPASSRVVTHRQALSA